MKRNVIIILIALVLVGIGFLPVSDQKQTFVKANFFNVYQRLSNGIYWKYWYRNLNDSSATLTNPDKNSFVIKHKNSTLSVKVQGYLFSASETNGNNTDNYTYFLVPQKSADSTVIITSKETNVAAYLLNAIRGNSGSAEHIHNFKLYMETPKLYYGFDITRNPLTDTTVLVMRKITLSKTKFEEAKRSLDILKDYLAKNELEQTQPFIAQFAKRGNDSTEVTVGLPIDRRVIAKGPFSLSLMPKTYSLYTLYYKGPFKDRVKALAAIQSFYRDRNKQMPFAPLEIYLDNKLPTSENDIINIRLTCPTY